MGISPTWGTAGAGFWAPDIVRIGDKLVLYYSLSVWDDPNPGIGVASADHPEGPWTDHGKLFTSQEIGVDNSMEMLEIAMEKQEKEKTDILYLLQDMREFELYGTVRAVVSVCDSMNYITDEEDLLQVFRLVSNYLDPGGIFIFDLNTVHKYRDILGDATIAENREECSFIWENDFDEEEGINEYDLTLFEREGELFRRLKETHYQRAYSPEEVRQAAEEAGMEFVALWDAFTREPLRADSDRMYMVFREVGKTERDE